MTSIVTNDLGAHTITLTVGPSQFVGSVMPDGELTVVVIMGKNINQWFTTFDAGFEYLKPMFAPYIAKALQNA